MELSEIAEKYAVGKANAAMEKAIAQAFADGYRQGYKDREDEIPVDLREKNTEFVDLGLPSGTLWAKEYETTDDGLLYLPYVKAENYTLPTKIQWEELIKYCKWGWYGKVFRCTGRNGETLDFPKTGRINPTYADGGNSFLWLRDNTQDDLKAYAWISCAAPQEIASCFMGYKLPIRQVR